MNEHTETTLEDCWKKHVQCVLGGEPTEGSYRDFTAGATSTLMLLRTQFGQDFKVKFDEMLLEAVSVYFDHPDRFPGNEGAEPMQRPWPNIETFLVMLKVSAQAGAAPPED